MISDNKINLLFFNKNLIFSFQNTFIKYPVYHSFIKYPVYFIKFRNNNIVTLI